MIVKVKFIKNGEPYGRSYTYNAPDTVRCNDMVELPSGGVGMVVEADTSKTAKDYPYKIKDIVRIVENDECGKAESV